MANVDLGNVQYVLCQRVIRWTNVVYVIWPEMASLDRNELSVTPAQHVLLSMVNYTTAWPRYQETIISTDILL